jgi:hypothetical protein
MVWEGKYDEYGHRREVDIAGCAMPVQKVCQRLNITPEQIIVFCEKCTLMSSRYSAQCCEKIFGSYIRNLAF